MICILIQIILVSFCTKIPHILGGNGWPLCMHASKFMCLQEVHWYPSSFGGIFFFCWKICNKSWWFLNMGATCAFKTFHNRSLELGSIMCMNIVCNWYMLSKTDNGTMLTIQMPNNQLLHSIFSHYLTSVSLIILKAWMWNYLIRILLSSVFLLVYVLSHFTGCAYKR